MRAPARSASSGHIGQPNGQPGARRAGPNRTAILLLALSGFLVTGAALWAQQIQLGGLSSIGADQGSAQDAGHKGHVILVSDAAQVQADKPQVLNLDFRVDPGFHINSHTPKDDLLIPTVLPLRRPSPLLHHRIASAAPRSSLPSAPPPRRRRSSASLSVPASMSLA